MKVTGVQAIPFAYERDRRIGDANLAVGSAWMSYVAVILETDEGLTGISVTNPGTIDSINALADAVIGEDPASVRGLWERMQSILFKRGATGEAGRALAGIDIALWDLKAKERGEPLWRTLGASKEPVGAYASGIDMPLDDVELRAFYDRMAGLGFTAGKLKVGLDPEADLRRLGIMCDSLLDANGKATLMVDANEFWSAKQAIRRVRELEENFDIAWVEEPVDRLDARALRQVSDGVRAAVATGENLMDTRSFVFLIEQGAPDVIQPYMACGGITGVLQVAELSYAHNIPLAMMNCPGHLTAHVAALFPNHTMMEVLDPQEPVVIRTSAEIVDGAIVLGDDPGHGMWLDMDELDAHRNVEPPGATLAPPYRRDPGARRHEAGRQPKRW